MFHQTNQFGVAPHAWLRHHVPWLGLIVMVLSLFGEEADLPFDADELNG